MSGTPKERGARVAEAAKLLRAGARQATSETMRSTTPKPSIWTHQPPIWAAKARGFVMGAEITDVECPRMEALINQGLAMRVNGRSAEMERWESYYSRTGGNVNGHY